MATREHIEGHEWANSGTVTDPGGAKQDLGWIAEKPAFQSANFVESRQDEMLGHIEQYGIPLWDALTTYVLGSLAIASDGILYRAIAGSFIGQDPTSSPSQWADAFIDTTSTQTITGEKTFDDLVLGGNMDADNLYKIVNLEPPTSNKDAANKAYVDSKGYQASGVTVFNATVAVADTWQDLDLSGQIGTNVALCFFEITATALQANFGIKPKGEGSVDFIRHKGEVAAGLAAGSGCSFGAFENATETVLYMTCAANSAGLVEIGAGNSGVAIAIKLIGYVL